MLLRISVLACMALAGVAAVEAQPLRVVAANLTSGNHQTYSPDNANHSNPEGAGARILKGLAPDVVLVQEFNTTVPVRQWVNATFGEEFDVYVEPHEGVANAIPNGVVSRYPIVEAGVWEDSQQENREFAWARIALPGGRRLWAVSVHLSASSNAKRRAETAALGRFVREIIPEEDLVVLGGDFNTSERHELCMESLRGEFDVDFGPPMDASGDPDTNAPRNKPYDRVLADRDLAGFVVPVRIGDAEFPAGLVFDSREFDPVTDVAPVQNGDSGVAGMQHMAVVRDFEIPPTSSESQSAEPAE